MTDAELRRLYGYAEIDPSGPAVAGSTGTWRITYHAGLYGVDDGGVIKVVWRFVSDWGAPQFKDPKAPEYATVSTTGPASVRAAFEMRRYVRPWNRCVTIDVFDESLSEGNTVTLTLGETSGGGPGSRAQTFCQEAFEFRVAVDWCGTGLFVEVPSPKFPVVSGTPHRLVVVGPSEAAAGEEVWVGVKAEDLWGNVCADYDGEVRLDGGGLEGLPEVHRFRPEDRGVRRFEGVRAPGPGVYRIRAEDREYRMAAEGNPLRCVERRGTYRPFWGDLHGQSEETIGTNPASSYFRFARDGALLDFVGHQGNDFQITREVWDEIRRQVKAYHAPQRFVTFLGYEWSGNTPLGGDHNVYYPGEDGPLHRSSHVLIPDTSDANMDCTTAPDLYAALKGQEAMLVPHVGGRYSNFDWHDPALERVIEVCSSWGEFEWFLREALARGYKVGFVAGSDDHKGRPGAAHPGSGSFGIYGGLACVYARELTRAGVWEALRARRCYGTTGQRILLEVTADGHPMGAEYAATGPPEVSVQVMGTGSVERADLFRGLEQVHRFPQRMERAEDRVRVSWSGQRIRARNRLAAWDGSLKIDRGRILRAEGYAFDAPSEGIREATDRRVAWKSVTTGDADGVILTIDAPPEAQLDFRTGIVSRRLSLREIAEGPVTVEAGGIDLKVIFERLPLGAGRDVSFTFREPDLPAGCHPYWVRVVQTDGAKAWSSPIYVTI